MSDIGYTVIEPPSLDGWLGNVKNQALLVALLTWLKHRLSQALGGDFPLMQIDIIKVQYLGTYPALGLCGDYPSDLPERIDVLVDRILQSSSVHDFMSFALEVDVDWDARARALLGS